MPRTIVTYPNPVLAKKAAPVAEITDEIRALAAEMIQLMYADKGIGLAAPQVGASLRLVVIDLSGRPGLSFHVDFTRATIGAFDVDLVREFFQGLTNHALMTLHIDNLRGENAHHQAETVFKAFGRALRMAIEPDPRSAGAIPSTKGSL